MTRPQLLTPNELKIIDLVGRAYELVEQVIGTDTTREDDLQEIRAAVHTIQRAMMAQAAARARPGSLRLLGETLHHRSGSSPSGEAG